MGGVRGLWWWSDSPAELLVNVELGGLVGHVLVAEVVEVGAEGLGDESAAVADPVPTDSSFHLRIEVPWQSYGHTRSGISSAHRTALPVCDTDRCKGDVRSLEPRASGRPLASRNSGLASAGKDHTENPTGVLGLL